MVTQWVKAQIDELVEEQMRSSTEVTKNDFKAVIEQFAQYMKTITQDLEDLVKNWQQKVAENLETTKLENAMIIKINDGPISEVDMPNINCLSIPGSSITLNS